MNADGEVLVPCLELLQGGVRLHRVSPVATDPTDLVVLDAHGIEREVDDHLRLWRRLEDALDPARDHLVLDPVRRDVDDARPAMAIRAFDHFGQVLAQGRLATTEREPVRGATERLEHAVPLRNSQVIVWEQPNVARLTPRVAAVAHANCDVDRQPEHSAGHVRRLQRRDLGYDLGQAHVGPTTAQPATAAARAGSRIAGSRIAGTGIEPATGGALGEKVIIAHASDTRVGSACPRSTSGKDSSRCASSATVRSASSRSPRSIKKNVPLSWIETIASRPTACFIWSATARVNCRAARTPSSSCSR